MNESVGESESVNVSAVINLMKEGCSGIKDSGWLLHRHTHMHTHTHTPTHTVKSTHNGERDMIKGIIKVKKLAVFSPSPVA